MPHTFPIKLGEHGQYELSEAALAHILRGDTTIRPADKASGRPQETVLAGGLHTWSGWKAFAALHPSVVHLLDFRAGVHDAWYYARELQNGVITLKIPKRLFTNKAAAITQMPDNYYKSGYLWKTLFPQRYSEDDVVRVIGQALIHLDREDSTPPQDANGSGILYGYADTDNPFTAIKVRIQVRGGSIMSAFPAWEQPLTGNNGKAYSHEHSIGFQVALSTMEYDIAGQPYGPVFPAKLFALDALLERTPSFIRLRAPRDRSQSVDVSQAVRSRVLRKFAGKATPADLDQIDDYLADYPCAKDPAGLQAWIYQEFKPQLAKSAELFNAAQLMENVGECIWVLAFCDNRFKSRRAVDAMVRFISMAVVHAGGLSTLMFKRLLGQIITIATAHWHRSALRDVLEALASSPSRAALYTEFDLNPFVKRNDDVGLAVIGLPHIVMELKPEHLVEFVAFNLGENSLALFNKQRRVQMATDLITANKQWDMATDVMARFAGSDFEFFMPEKLDLSTLKLKDLPEEKDLEAIVRDYGRMLVMLRQRIVLEDLEAYRTEPDYSLYGTQAFFEHTRQRHKRALVLFTHTNMLKACLKFAEEVGYAGLGEACKEALERQATERIPMPKYIPDYINNWRHKLKAEDLASEVKLEEAFAQPT